METVFVLGRDWKLSLLELASVLKAGGTEFRLLGFSPKAALLELPEGFALKPFFSGLGGTLKACQVIWRGSPSELGKRGLAKLEEFLEAQYFDRKLLFGVSDYLAEGQAKEAGEELAGALKAHFRKKRVKAVMKKPKRHSEEKFAPKAINPSDYFTWKLDENGTEFVLSQGGGKEIVLSRTIECFNPREFEERDKAMPYREKLESISIRLARILVNLSRANGGKIVLDPFCGTGTIMVEAGLLGLESVGVEVDQEKCGKCEKNLKWAKAKYGIGAGAKVYCNDCTRLAGFMNPGSYDCVATEPYMGPLLAKALSRGEAERLAQELERTYFAMFREIAKTIPRKGLVAIILPVIPYFDKLKKESVMVSDRVWRANGFQIRNEIENELPGALPYDYMPEKSRIGRRILVLGRRE